MQHRGFRLFFLVLCRCLAGDSSSCLRLDLVLPNRNIKAHEERAKTTRPPPTKKEKAPLPAQPKKRKRKRRRETAKAFHKPASSSSAPSQAEPYHVSSPYNSPYPSIGGYSRPPSSSNHSRSSSDSDSPSAQSPRCHLDCRGLRTDGCDAARGAGRGGCCGRVLGRMSLLLLMWWLWKGRFDC